MRRLFISDLHLGEHDPNLEQLFNAFMAQLPQKGDHLYILGDFFEAWIGDDAVSPMAGRVIAKLKHFSDNIGQGYILHGNRDFLIGQIFCDQTGFKLIQEPYSIKLNNTACCLLHGDSLCTDDVDYQAFKQMVRQPDWQKEFLSKSIDERLEIARALREQSQASMQQKSEEIIDANNDAILNLFATSQAEIIIHGHTHRQNIHHYEISKQRRQRIVLGDWGETASVLIVDENGFDLKNYTLEELS